MLAWADCARVSAAAHAAAHTQVAAVQRVTLASCMPIALTFAGLHTGSEQFGCGFFGSRELDFYCSVCFRSTHGEEEFRRRTELQRIANAPLVPQVANAPTVPHVPAGDATPPGDISLQDAIATSPRVTPPAVPPPAVPALTTPGAALTPTPAIVPAGDLVQPQLRTGGRSENTRRFCGSCHACSYRTERPRNPCNNGASCTWKHCKFAHTCPVCTTGEKATGSKIPCDFGIRCTKSTCRFAHPSKSLVCTNQVDDDRGTSREPKVYTRA